MDITGVGQEELVCMLRSTRQGESVSLVVLRQEDMFLPREMVRASHSERRVLRGAPSGFLLTILFSQCCFWSDQQTCPDDA